MKERDRIRQFDADVERLIHQGASTPAAHPDDEHLLEIARALAETDLSGESQRLEAIRQHLVDMAASCERGQVAQNSTYPQERNKTSRHDYRENHERHEPMRKSPLVAIFSIGVVTLAVLAFVGLVFIWPSMRSGEAGSAPTATPAEIPADLTTAPTATPTPLRSSRGFAPLSPLRLPAGVYEMLVEDLGGLEGQRVVFYNRGDDRFLSVTQRARSISAPQPQGTLYWLGKLDTVIETGLSGSITFSDPEDRTIHYTHGISLTGDDTASDTRVEIISNLPQEDVVSFAETLALTFAPYHLTFRPPDSYASRGVIAVRMGLMLTEDRYFGNERFVILTQEVAEYASGLPSEGQPVTIGGLPGMLVDGLEGEAHIVDDTSFQDGVEPGGVESIIVAGGGGGGGGSGGGCDEEGNCSTATPEPHLNPPTIPFDNGIRLVWIRNGVRIDMLSNLPQEELLQVAEGLEVGSVPAPVIEPEVDISVLPKGGVLAGYKINHSQLPEDFWDSLAWVEDLTVTEGTAQIAGSPYFGNGQGLIIESRCYNNDHFAIFTTIKDSGAPLPDGQSIEIGGKPAALQSGLSGTALLSLAKFNTLQDGIPRLFMGGGGGGDSENYQPPPDSMPYTDGKLLTWASDGARITLLSNLPEEEVLRIAETTVIGKTYEFIHPNTLAHGQISASGFDLWGPTYIPEGLDSIVTAVDQEGMPDILYGQFQPDDRLTSFVRLTQRAAQPGDNLPAGPVITINGLPAVVNSVSGTLVPPEYLGQKPVAYTDAVQITWIVNGTWIQILTNVSREESIHIVESMVPAR